MPIDDARVLVLGEENGRMFALCSYLAFRGYQVDRAQELDEAASLVRNLRYRSVIARLQESTDGNDYLQLLRELKQRAFVHTVVLLDSPTGPVQNIDSVFGAEHSIALIARSICQRLSA
ncbi:MAG: hypothetical protein MNPFHGCM_01410 [Gemmatimonadaceae bacterium]|nr:hypothetical protein [Gemmatimonadaceae bacterium]